ncbi:MAG: sugar ABC transporter substrate-binding protein [Methylococcales bacterium]|nr:sugar ABC transporter substrate-binding protein [Methylococcales bacterium]
MQTNKLGLSSFNAHRALIFCLFIGCSTLVLFFILSKNDSDNFDAHIAVFIPGSVPFFDIQTKAIESTAAKFNIKTTFFNAGWDPLIQIQQLQNALSFGVDAIALASVDNQSLKAAPEIVAKYNIPLLTFTNAIGTDRYGKYPKVLAHVGRDEIEAGQLIAKQIELLRQQQPTTIMLVQGAAGTPPQRHRELGFFQIISQHSNWKVVKNININEWDSEIVEHEVQKLYQSGQVVDVIATQWAQASLAAAHVVKKHATKINIVGLEFNKAIKKGMLAGNISYSTNFSIEDEGRIAIMTLINLMKEKKPKGFLPIKQVIIDASAAASIIPEY